MNKPLARVRALSTRRAAVHNSRRRTVIDERTPPADIETVTYPKCQARFGALNAGRSE